MTRLDKLFSFLEGQPDDAFLLFAIAKEYESAGDDTNALDYYQKLQQTTPQYVGLYYHLGKLFERKGESHNALSTYKSGIEVAQKERDFHALSELKGAKMSLDGDDDDE
ncbi:MAG: tetratricopeptide repeat protein [Saprospiraceae bacterium]|nr:tetratricopeptide repeat protein [Saprospiraceae bacterium]